MRPRPAEATGHLRPVLTDGLSRAAQLPPRRRTCAPQVVWSVVLFAAACARSAATACAAIAGAPSGQAIWGCLYRARPTRRRTRERRSLPALHAPLGNRPRRADVTVDDRRIGYFGEPDPDTTRSKQIGCGGWPWA